MFFRKNNDEDNPTRHIFTEITAAIVFFMILFIFIQQFEFIEIFKVFKIKQLQMHIKNEVEQAFTKKGFEDRMPKIIVGSDNPLVQKIMMSNRVLTFPELSASLRTQRNREVLQIVGEILKKNATVYEALKIEGHADEQKLPSYSVFPTNWELSSARATTVVRYLTDTDKVAYPPEKISSVGFSYYHPIDPNDYAANRRIEFVIRYSYAKEYMYSKRANEIYKSLNDIQSGITQKQ